jgi:hypothetical protein
MAMAKHFHRVQRELFACIGPWRLSSIFETGLFVLIIVGPINFARGTLSDKLTLFEVLPALKALFWFLG